MNGTVRMAMLCAATGVTEPVPVAWKRHHPDDAPQRLTAQDVERIAAAETKRERRRKRGW